MRIDTSPGHPANGSGTTADSVQVELSAEVLRRLLIERRIVASELRSNNEGLGQARNHLNQRVLRSSSNSKR